MTIICPECKNQVDYTEAILSLGTIIECNHCGMTLKAAGMEGEDRVIVEIVDEGK